MEPEPKPKSWERRDGESAQAYAAFCAYFEMPARERSIDAAYRLDLAASEHQEGSGNRADRRAPRRWFTWSADHEWVARAAAHDAHLAERERQLWEERRLEVRRRDWNEAAAIRDVILAAIPDAHQFIREERHVIPGGRGRPTEIHITRSFDITGLTLALERASKVQRLAADEPTENVNLLSGAALDAALDAALRRLAEVADGDEAGGAEAGLPADEGDREPPG